MAAYTTLLHRLLSVSHTQRRNSSGKLFIRPPEPPALARLTSAIVVFATTARHHLHYTIISDWEVLLVMWLMGYQQLFKHYLVCCAIGPNLITETKVHNKLAESFVKIVDEEPVKHWSFHIDGEPELSHSQCSKKWIAVYNCRDAWDLAAEICLSQLPAKSFFHGTIDSI